MSCGNVYEDDLKSKSKGLGISLDLWSVAFVVGHFLGGFSLVD